MKRKSLCLLIAMALGASAFAVQAQDSQDAMGVQSSATGQMDWPNGYDNRWYVAPTVGVYHNDTDRKSTKPNRAFYGISVGRYLSNNISLEAFADHTKRHRSQGPGHSWINNAVGVKANYYFRDWNAWRPFLSAGLLGSHHSSDSDSGWSPAAQVGVGLQKTFSQHADFRVEADYRYDRDDKTSKDRKIPKTNHYGDIMLGVSVVARLGSVPAAPEASAPSCEELDDDNDGVNNCDDMCPNTPEGVLVGPDGCPQTVVIDLRGVNFKFDRPSKGETNIESTLQEPTSDSMDTLEQAVDILDRYPEVRVTVAGYTDSTGPANYNQGLSERRASIVYDYLTDHGIDPSRMDGPIGYGENDPVADNSTKEGRALNRRTELQVDDSTAEVEQQQ